MGNFIAVIVLIGMLIGLGWAIHDSGYDSGVADTKVLLAAGIIEATKKARAEEQKKQEKVNDILQKQRDDQALINDQLNADLDKLRNRPDRRHLSDKPEADCKSATGVDLSSQDAGFLTREAARADELRAGLKACYAYADSITTE